MLVRNTNDGTMYWAEPHDADDKKIRITLIDEIHPTDFLRAGEETFSCYFEILSEGEAENEFAKIIERHEKAVRSAERRLHRAKEKLRSQIEIIEYLRNRDKVQEV